jgi:hypothetical protein
MEQFRGQDNSFILAETLPRIISRKVATADGFEKQRLGKTVIETTDGLSISAERVSTTLETFDQSLSALNVGPTTDIPFSVNT